MFIFLRRKVNRNLHITIQKLRTRRKRMKKGIRKMLSAIACAALAMGCLAGCGSNTNSSVANTTTESAAENTPTAAAETASDSTAADDKVYQIGICQLVQHDALDRATQGFEDALVKLLGENHVAFNVQNAQGDSQTCATIANQFVNGGVDLIMANATAALQACSNATSTIPVVGTSVTSFAAALDIELDANGCTGINVTGTNDLAPLDQQAQIIADLFPDVRQVGILYCSAEVNSVYQAEHIAAYLDDLNIKHKDFSFSDSNDLQAVTNNCVSECDVIYVPTDNVVSSNQSIIDAVARPAGVPIICGEESQCTGCGLASLSIDFYDIGYRAGEQAYDILVNGKNPAEMPVEAPQSLTRIYNPQIASDLGITLGDDYQAIEQ